MFDRLRARLRWLEIRHKLPPSCTYRAERDVSEKFLATVASWIAETKEVMVLFRFLAAAGRIEYGLYASAADFCAACEKAPIGTDIIAFRDSTLTLRGVVDDEFVRRAQEMIPADDDYLLIELEPHEYSTVALRGAFDKGHASLLCELVELKGRHVAVGICPDWLQPDHVRMVSAAKGGVDGPR